MKSCKPGRTNGRRHSAPRRTMQRRLWRGAVALLVTALVFASPAAALLEITVPDASVAENAVAPSAADPGPVFYSTSDGMTFASSLTNVENVWYADLTVTNNTTASSTTIQGSVHTFSDWFYLNQDSNSKFSSPRATGVYDSDAASYTAPFLFTKSSQGTLTITSYNAADPSTGPTSTTFYWIYSATANRYVIGTTKNLASETQLAPISDTLGLNFVKTLDTNSYVIASVGGAPNYLPTIKQGFHLPLLSLPLSHTWYALMDAPAGVHEDTYTYTLQVTAQSV